MPQVEKREVNASKDENMKCPCSKCAGKTFHKVLLSIDDSGEESDGYDWEVYWSDKYQIIECQGCKTVSFRHVHSNSEEWEPNDEEYIESEDLYPSRVEGRVGIGNTIVYLPPKVQQIYMETLQALNGKSPILAGIGLRALVETVCKEEDADGNSLFDRVDDLVEKKILTPAGASILHKIRTLGNDAAHESRPHSDKQLSLAMDVVEHLLKDVYIIPKRIEAEF